MELDTRLLVTGAGGQLGRSIGRLAPEAVLLDRQALDITQPDRVLEAILRLRPRVIVHAAAYTRVDAAEEDPVGAWAVNVEGTRAVAEAARRVGGLVVYVSTDYVFSGSKDGPYREEDETGPLSVYGATKLEGERVVAELDQHLIVRTSWLFGEGRNFFRRILELADGTEELTVVDDQRGRPTYAPDLARGILDLAERGLIGTYHLTGGGEPATWAEAAELALAAAGRDAKVRRISSADYLANRAGRVARRPANSVLECSKAASHGIALRPWQEAVEEYVKQGSIG